MGLLMAGFIQAEQRRTPLLAEVHATLVNHNAGNPGTEARLFAEGMQMLEGTAVSRLHGILRIGLIAKDGPRDAQRRSIMAADQLGHCFLIALFALCDQFLVGGL
jgi:hypothetical protein